MISTSLKWKEGMAFTADVGTHQVPMDSRAPLGKNTGPTPKELVGVGLAGCTAMDIIALLKKHKQDVQSFETVVEIETTPSGYPAVFEKILIVFKLNGTIDPARAIEAVQLSQTKYCGVSAMLSKVAPISYRVELNGTEIGKGQAEFSNYNP